MRTQRQTHLLARSLHLLGAYHLKMALNRHLCAHHNALSALSAEVLNWWRSQDTLATTGQAHGGLQEKQALLPVMMTLWWVKAPRLPARVGLIHQNTASGAQCHFENGKCLRIWEAFNVSYHTQLPQAKYCVCSWVDWHSIGVEGSFLFPPWGWKYGRFPPTAIFCCYFWMPCGFSPSSVITFLKTSCLLASIKTKKEEGGVADSTGAEEHPQSKAPKDVRS